MQFQAEGLLHAGHETQRLGLSLGVSPSQQPDDVESIILTFQIRDQGCPAQSCPPHTPHKQTSLAGNPDYLRPVPYSNA